MLNLKYNKGGIIMNKKKVFTIFFLSFTILIFGIFALFNNKKEVYNISNINGIQIKGDTTRYPVKLLEKIDGDTIVVIFNNKELKVRYLLIDTPETVKPGTPVQKYGPEASDLNGKILKNAKKIELEFDIYEKQDKYHRALCYVYADGKSVQEQLLTAGLAEIKYIKEPDNKYLKIFKKAQSIAKSNKRNLWA